MEKLLGFPESQQEQALTEYAMIIGFVALLMIAGVAVFGENLNELYTAVAAGLD